MSATAVKARLYVCAFCGRKDIAERMVRSSHTGDRYCANLFECDKRSKRRK